MPLLLLVLTLLAAGADSAAAGVYRGTLTTTVADDFANGRSRERVVLATGATMRPVRAEDGWTRRAMRGAIGSEVVLSASGGPGDGALAVESVERVGTAAAPERTPRVAVLRLDFTDDRSVPVTAERARTVWFDGATSVRAFYEQQSFASMHVTGGVHGVYELGIPGAGCDIDAVAQAADAAATADGVDLAAYDHVAYVHPFVDDCSWAGLAQLPGRRMWINGDHGLRVLAHELGHNLGAAHANALTCTDAGATVAISDTCTNHEYADPFDVMGGGSTTLMSSWHRHEVGHYEGDAAAVREVTASGTYVLDSADDEGGADVLTIARPGAPQHYALELRSPAAPFDDFAPAHPAVTGVTVRLAGGGTWWNDATRLVDAHPGGGWSDAPVPAGGQVVEPARGIRIRVESVAGGQAAVTVTLGDGDLAPPTAPQLTATRDASGVHLTWTAATDDTGVAGYEVRRDGGTLATVTGTAYDDVPPAAGSYRYDVVAIDMAGNRTASNEATVVVPDTTPPSAPTITSVSRQGAFVTLRWSPSTDDVALRGYRVWVGGVAAGETTAQQFVHAIDRTGTFTYRVESVDTAGNVASSQPIELVVPDEAPPVDDGDDGEPVAPFTPPLQTIAAPGPGPGPGSGGATAPVPPRREVVRSPLRFRLTPGLGEVAGKRVTVRVSSASARLSSVVLAVDGTRRARCRGGRRATAITCSARIPRRARTGAHRLRILAKARPRGARRARPAGLDLALVDGRLALP